jgi:cell division septum initiation protein DivIVA
LINKEEAMLRKALRGGAKHDVDEYTEGLSAVVEKQLESLNALKAKLDELRQGLSEELTMSRRPPQPAAADSATDWTRS